MKIITIICDSCGEEIKDHRKAITMDYNYPSSEASYRRADLCKECSKKFGDLIKVKIRL